MIVDVFKVLFIQGRIGLILQIYEFINSFLFKMNRIWPFLHFKPVLIF